MSDDQLFDDSVVAAMADDLDPALIPHLLETFEQEIATRYTTMLGAVQGGHADLTRLLDQAHALKAAAATYGATLLEQWCLEVETAARTGNASKARTLVPEMKPVVDATRSAVSARQRGYQMDF